MRNPSTTAKKMLRAAASSRGTITWWEILTVLLFMAVYMTFRTTINSGFQAITHHLFHILNSYQHHRPGSAGGTTLPGQKPPAHTSTPTVPTKH